VRILVWLTEGTWEACVDAARESPGDVTLLHVTDAGAGAALSGPVGLLGRSGRAATDLLAEAERALFAAAADRLGRRAEQRALAGRPERAVVGACVDADLLILARDGDHTRLGPRSLGHATRFVVDHAPCRVLLVWPDEPPELATIPPPPKGPPPPPPHG
jgi:nucleotide-binding universal stress UspA family protein